MSYELLEVLVYGPGQHRFDPAEHPDATHMRALLQSGSGSGSDPGAQPGQAVSTDLIPVEEVPIEVGRAGRASDGTPGEDGVVLLELYRPR